MLTCITTIFTVLPLMEGSLQRGALADLLGTAFRCSEGPHKSQSGVLWVESNPPRRLVASVYGMDQPARLQRRLLVKSAQDLSVRLSTVRWM